MFKFINSFAYIKQWKELRKKWRRTFAFVLLKQKTDERILEVVAL